MATRTLEPSPAYSISREDVRAALTGMALAAHASNDPATVTILEAAASRLVGKQLPDNVGFGRLVACAEELFAVRSGFIPDGLLTEHSYPVAFEIAEQDCQDNLGSALDAFGA